MKLLCPSVVVVWRNKWSRRSAASRYRGLFLPGCLLVLSLLLLSCTGDGGEKKPSNSTPQVQQKALSELRWCGDKPIISFRDQGASTPTATGTPTGGTPVPTPAPVTISDWGQVQNKLGFTVFLPKSLPEGSCLMSAFGTLNDPTFGSSFTIGFLLPDQSALSLSEAPLKSQTMAFQCSPSPENSTDGEEKPKQGTPQATPKTNQIPIQLCSGSRDKTNIVFSARGTTENLKKIFDELQANVEWVPTS